MMQTPYVFPDVDGLGLTKREMLAGMAMQALLSGALKPLHCMKDEFKLTLQFFDEVIARAAVIHADALIAELAKEPSK